MALSNDIRKRIVESWKHKEGSIIAIAQRFKVGSSTVKRLIKLDRNGGDLTKRSHPTGRRSKILPSQHSDLIQLVKEKPDRTAEELRAIWQERTAVQLSRSSMVRALLRCGFTLKKRPSVRRSVTWKKIKKSERFLKVS